MDPKVKAVIDTLECEFAKAEADRERAGAPVDFETAALEAGPEVAGMLNLLIRAMGAVSIVEVGTSYGYTALWLGEAARDTGGRVIGTEVVAAKHARACEAVAAARLSEFVDIRHGDAKEVLDEIPGPIDLAFIDAWKPDYPAYFDALLPRMRLGGCIVADNMTFPEYAREAARAYQAHVRANRGVRSMELPIGDGVEMTVRVC